MKVMELEAGSSVRYEATVGMFVGADIAVMFMGVNLCILDIDVWVYLFLLFMYMLGMMVVVLDV